MTFLKKCMMLLGNGAFHGWLMAGLMVKAKETLKLWIAAKEYRI
jgi:hypothetical protein